MPQPTGTCPRCGIRRTIKPGRSAGLCRDCYRTTTSGSTIALTDGQRVTAGPIKRWQPW